ncbi:HIT-like domain-containing protein [Macrophomina phaseolina]|uniref:HIT-like domain-containing protein n=1 Tax=Macrophomina phaseolina TaxID=35725 RepID=A0ABQ8FWK5_9PEZI|nr:HIT-like domain-containing protein [Macrophomina phaseolina]
MVEAKEIAERYPEPCPFCSISAAYPPHTTASSASAGEQKPDRELLDCIPSSAAVEPARVEPAAFIVLSAPRVMAFLDILPMTRGHLLVTTREHRGKVQDVEGLEGRDVGFWLPLLAKTVARVTGVTDYNLVQNNGARAAQVVPHVHFHIIPRPPRMPELKNKSWTMFGRGQREDLDDDEASKLVEEMRSVLREEVKKLGKSRL